MTVKVVGPASTSEKTQETQKEHAKFFAAVRQRGVLNHMLDEPVKRFEKENPGFRCRWEYAPANGDKTMIVAREGMGFFIVDRSKLGTLTSSEATEGPVKVGDLILMAAPEHIVDAIEMDDAKAAWDDSKLPETAYRENLRGIQVLGRDGAILSPEAAGQIKTHQEVLGAPRAGLDHEPEGGD